MGLALPAIADGAKGERLIGLYDVLPNFDGSSFDWMAISDAYMTQIINSAGSNKGIIPRCLPQRIMGNTQPQRMGPPDNTAGLDYIIEGDLVKSGNEYRIDIFMVDYDREVVARGSSAPFSEPKDAVWAAQMAALNLGGSDSGSKRLADVILDWEQNQRERYAHKCAIGATLTWDLPESDKNDLRMEPGEEKELSLKLVDYDDYQLAGRKLTIETVQGKVEPTEIKTDSDGKAKVTYTAPDKPEEVTIRAAWEEYCYGSMHPTRQPAVDLLNIKMTPPSYVGMVSLKRTGLGANGIIYNDQAEFQVNLKQSYNAQGIRIWEEEGGIPVSLIIDNTTESKPSVHVSSNGRQSLIDKENAISLEFDSDHYSLVITGTVYESCTYQCEGSSFTSSGVIFGVQVTVTLPADTSRLNDKMTITDLMGTQVDVSWNLKRVDQ